MQRKSFLRLVFYSRKSFPIFSRDASTAILQPSAREVSKGTRCCRIGNIYRLSNVEKELGKRLKGQVTFFEALLVVCLSLIIPRITFFFIKIRFQAEKCIYIPLSA